MQENTELSTPNVSQSQSNMNKKNFYHGQCKRGCVTCLAALDGWIRVVFVMVPNAALLLAGGLPWRSSLLVFLTP